RVELIEVDAVEPKPAQAALACPLQVVRPAVGPPLPGAWSAVAALGRDDEVRWVRPQRLGDQAFADVGTIGIGRVDEIDAQLNGAAQDDPRPAGCAWLAPDPAPSESHGAVAKAAHGQLTPDDD